MCNRILIIETQPKWTRTKKVARRPLTWATTVRPVTMISYRSICDAVDRFRWSWPSWTHWVPVGWTGCGTRATLLHRKNWNFGCNDISRQSFILCSSRRHKTSLGTMLSTDKSFSVYDSSAGLLMVADASKMQPLKQLNRSFMLDDSVFEKTTTSADFLDVKFGIGDVSTCIYTIYNIESGFSMILVHF